MSNVKGDFPIRTFADQHVRVRLRCLTWQVQDDEPMLCLTEVWIVYHQSTVTVAVF